MYHLLPSSPQNPCIWNFVWRRCRFSDGDQDLLSAAVPLQGILSLVELRKWYFYIWPGNSQKNYSWDCVVHKHYFMNREFSFTLASDTYIRFQSYKDEQELKNDILLKNPVKIDIGAIYNIKVPWNNSIKKICEVFLDPQLVLCSQKTRRPLSEHNLPHFNASWSLILIWLIMTKSVPVAGKQVRNYYTAATL